MKPAHEHYEPLLADFASALASSHLDGDASVLMRGARFAAEAHAEVKQLEAYTGRAYIAHSLAVANIMLAFGLSVDEVLAALMHDVLEDTRRTKADIEERFGWEVAALVAEVTNVSKREDGTRVVRKAMDREHFARASPRGQNVKLGDVAVNAKSIATLDERFARTYLLEKAELLKVLIQGDERLKVLARGSVRDGLAALGIVMLEG